MTSTRLPLGTGSGSNDHPRSREVAESPVAIRDQGPGPRPPTALKTRRPGDGGPRRSVTSGRDGDGDAGGRLQV